MERALPGVGGTKGLILPPDFFVGDLNGKEENLLLQPLVSQGARAVRRDVSSPIRKS